VNELRLEILEAEKARSDLLKWKLVLVAALGTIGLGLTETNVGHPVVLIGIPLVCAYVDLLCRHLTLRIHVIGYFMRSRPEVKPVNRDLDWQQNFFRKYEEFADRNRAAFILETVALTVSSVLLSGAVAAYGGYLAKTSKQTSVWTERALIGFGLVGIVLALLVERTFGSTKNMIGSQRETQSCHGSKRGRQGLVTFQQGPRSLECRR
jgi:hypothetical protein